MAPAWAGTLLVVLAAGCGGASPGEPTAGNAAAAPAARLPRNDAPRVKPLAGTANPSAGSGRGEPSRRWFVDVTEQLGLPVRHEPWPDGQFNLPEIMAGGLALFDANGDGRTDLLQVRYPPPSGPTEPAPDRLFLQSESGRFIEALDSGLEDPGYGQGAAVGDIDGDGDPDVLITNFGPNRLYRNTGGGKFEDITAEAGLTAGAEWSTAAAFVDYDRDGDLDLMVVHYVEFDPGVVCKLPNTVRDYCGPDSFRPTTDQLFENLGNGRFREVTQTAGIDLPGKGLGLICGDFTGDGWVDLYVANDGEPNYLWVNQTDGTFREEALLRGVAVDGSGKPEASMGLVAADWNHDGQWDLLSTHLRGETNTLYLSQRPGYFRDGSAATGLAAIDRPYTGFGCAVLDIDLDGDSDLAVANGRVYRGPSNESAPTSPFWRQFVEPNLLIAGDGQGKFRSLATEGGDFTQSLAASRGLAATDLDADGDLDLVVADLADTWRVYRNDAPRAGNHWLVVRPLTAGRDALGATVRIEAGGKAQSRLCVAAASYLTSGDPRAHFGLGPHARVERVEVEWPSGRRERFSVDEVDQVLEVVESTGSPP